MKNPMAWAGLLFLVYLLAKGQATTWLALAVTPNATLPPSQGGSGNVHNAAPGTFSQPNSQLDPTFQGQAQGQGQTQSFTGLPGNSTGLGGFA